MNDLWTIGEIVAAVNGQLDGKLGGALVTSVPELSDQGIGSVSIDTRTLEAEALYVAIKGVSQDGHLYVGAAFKAGAKACLVSKDFEFGEQLEVDGVLIRVEDTLAALEAMAVAARNRTSAKIIAVTGSAGKTGTKEALREMFELCGKTHASVKSFNNHWGVPLSLTRMPRDCEFGIFEVGMNHSGEISPLSKLIRPDIALITTVAPAHIGHFANEEEIADAKAEIFDGLVEGGTVLLPADNRHFERLCLAAEKAGVGNVLSFGEVATADVKLLTGKFGSEVSEIKADCLGEMVEFRVSIPGPHIAMNFLGALGCIKLAGCELTGVVSVLGSLIAPPGRGVRHVLSLEPGQLTNERGTDSTALVIDESYNANPPSMEIALKTLGAMKENTYCRRIAVLGDMLELGDHSEFYHRQIAPLINSLDVDLVFASGEMMAHMFKDLPESKRGVYATHSHELIAPLEESLQSGDVIMIKGSLGSDMGCVVAALCEKHK